MSDYAKTLRRVGEKANEIGHELVSELIGSGVVMDSAEITGNELIAAADEIDALEDLVSKLAEATLWIQPSSPWRISIDVDDCGCTGSGWLDDVLGAEHVDRLVMMAKEQG